MAKPIYRTTDAGWQVIRERDQCAVYADFSGGTRLWLSYRGDLGVARLSLIDEGWRVSPLNGKVILRIELLPDNSVHDSIATMLASSTGAHGYHGDCFDLALVDRLAASARLNASVIDGRGVPELFASLDIGGSEEAVRSLRSCNSNFFPHATGDGS